MVEGDADRPDTLTPRNNLAYAHRWAGQSDEAIQLYEQSLADRVRVFGPDHPRSLAPGNDLAHAYEAGALLTDEPRASQVAGELTRLGLGLSLDDFGTGHASLQQLRLLPLTEVKVDRAYVSGIVESAADRAVVTSVHELARALGVVVVAEGVEDRRTADALASLPGIIGQGWHFGAPMRPDELHKHIDAEATQVR
jgi:EAL domain-containing protein (putative c-di-GMP-specific phosphodiesterase class I)